MGFAAAGLEPAASPLSRTRRCPPVPLQTMLLSIGVAASGMVPAATPPLVLALPLCGRSMHWHLFQTFLHAPHVAVERLRVHLHPLHHLGGALSGGVTLSVPPKGRPHHAHVQLAPCALYVAGRPVGKSPLGIPSCTSHLAVVGFGRNAVARHRCPLVAVGRLPTVGVRRKSSFVSGSARRFNHGVKPLFVTVFMGRRTSLCMRSRSSVCPAWACRMTVLTACLRVSSHAGAPCRHVNPLLIPHPFSRATLMLASRSAG